MRERLLSWSPFASARSAETLAWSICKKVADPLRLKCLTIGSVMRDVVIDTGLAETVKNVSKRGDKHDLDNIVCLVSECLDFKGYRVSGPQPPAFKAAWQPVYAEKAIRGCCAMLVRNYRDFKWKCQVTPFGELNLRRIITGEL